MGLLKIRDKNGVEREVVALKGEPGGFSPHTHPVEEIFRGESTVDKFLGEVADKATVAITTATGVANDVMTLGAQLDEHSHGLADIEYHGDEYDSAYDYVAAIGDTADVAHQYATEAHGVAQTAQSDALTAQQTADEALAGVEVANAKTSELTAQMGDIETALDSIIEIQNALIGGDGE